MNATPGDQPLKKDEKEKAELGNGLQGSEAGIPFWGAGPTAGQAGSLRDGGWMDDELVTLSRLAAVSNLTHKIPAADPPWSSGQASFGRAVDYCRVYRGESGIYVDDVLVYWWDNYYWTPRERSQCYVVTLFLVPFPTSGWVAAGVWARRDDYEMRMRDSGPIVSEEKSSPDEAIAALMSQRTYKDYVFPVVVVSSDKRFYVVDRGPFWVREDPPPGTIIMWKSYDSPPYGWEDITPLGDSRIVIASREFVSDGGVTDITEFNLNDHIVRGRFKEASDEEPGRYAVRYFDPGPVSFKYTAVRLIRKK